AGFCDPLHCGRPSANKDVLAPIGLPCIVLPAVAYVRPAIVLARSYNVDLIPALWAVIQEPQLARLWIESQPFGVLESVRPGLGEHCRAAEPRIAARNRSIAIDVHHAPCEVAPFIRVVEEGMLHAVQFRLVQPKPVGAPNKETTIGSHDHSPLPNSIANHLEIFQTPRVVTQASPGHTLPSDLHGSPLRQRYCPHSLVEIFERPGACGLTHRWREIGKVDHPGSCEVRVEHYLMQSLSPHRPHAGHSLDGSRYGPIGLHHTHRPSVLRHEKGPVRQERKRPRSVKTLRHDLRLERC